MTKVQPRSLAATSELSSDTPKKKTLSSYVANTISSSLHYLRKDNSECQSTRSRSTGSHASSEASVEPPITHAKPPASPEEVEEQLDGILYAIGQLQHLQLHGRYIAAREVQNLRRAFTFAVSEEAIHRATSQGEAVDLPVVKLHKEVVAGIDAGGIDTMKSDNTVASGESGGAVSAVNPITPTTENGGRRRHRGKQNAIPSTTDYSPKAAAADRLLGGLEQYVNQNTRSRSFDVSNPNFSWSSVFHTPGERRLQSLVVSLFIFFTGIPISLLIAGILLSYRYTAPFMVLYLIYMFTWGRPVHPIHRNMTFTRCFLWRYYRDYFPVRLVLSKMVRRRFDPQKNYVFAYHPHGVHTFGALMNFGLDMNDISRLLPGLSIHLQTLGLNFYVPFWRHLMVWMGCGDASASCIRKTLQSGPGSSVMLVVGGAEESLLAKPNTNDLLLFRRKGFIKIALQHGAPLVPVYGFGENNVYNVSELAEEPLVRRILQKVKRYTGFAIPLIVGRGFFTFRFGLLPHRRPIVVVVGEPIELPKIANPSDAELEYWQSRYIDALQRVYKEHRGIFDLESTGLRIM